MGSILESSRKWVVDPLTCLRIKGDRGGEWACPSAAFLSCFQDRTVNAREPQCVLLKVVVVSQRNPLSHSPVL